MCVCVCVSGRWVIVYVCVCSLWWCCFPPPLPFFLKNIMNQLSRLWSELIWIIADEDRKTLSTQRGFTSSSSIARTDQYFPWRRCSALCVEGRGSIMGHPTDIICLPICTLLAKPGLRNSFTEQSYGSECLYFKQFPVREKVSYRPLLSDFSPWLWLQQNLDLWPSQLSQKGLKTYLNLPQKCVLLIVNYFRCLS